MNGILKFSVMAFCMIFLLCVVMTLFFVSMAMNNFGSQRLYSQALDAGVTVATVNTMVNSTVAIANANAAAVKAIADAGGDAQYRAQETQPVQQPAAADDSGGWLWSFIKGGFWLAVGLFVVFGFVIVFKGGAA